MLHIFAQSPLDLCVLDRIDTGDSVLFIRSAAFVVIADHVFNVRLKELLKQNQLCVLATDLEARGILPDQVLGGIEIIDYDEFVDLTIQHTVINSWGDQFNG